MSRPEREENGGHMSDETWDAGWEVGFPATTMDELLLALVVRDLVHGSSFDVEAVEDGSEIALDFLAGDELDGETYQLLLSAEVAGSDNRDMVLAFTEEMLEGLVDEAQELIARREDLGSREMRIWCSGPFPRTRSGGTWCLPIGWRPMAPKFPSASVPSKWGATSRGRTRGPRRPRPGHPCAHRRCSARLRNSRSGGVGRRRSRSRGEGLPIHPAGGEQFLRAWTQTVR